jgi:predicted ATPase
MLRRIGDEAYARLLAVHHRIVRSALQRHEGEEVDTQGDAFFAVFSSPRACVASAYDIQKEIARDSLLGAEAVRVRMGIHSGEAERTPAGVVGLDVHRAARIAGVAHGGQVLVSESTAVLARAALEGGLALRDLGRHRLKDLGQPEQLYQLVGPGLESDFPPLRSLDNPAHPNNLPAQLASFVGRRSELSEVRARLGASRLVTLTGAGGCGKTRLALQVAAELLEETADGVFLVELAPLADAQGVADAVREALRIAPRPGRTATETLLDALAPQHLLLVLDNCEHLVEACARFAEALLRRCPAVQLLATSREPLGIPGESIYRVPSLSVPEEGSSGELGEAVTLFIDRARAQGASVELDTDNLGCIASICRRLDGMPLAVELAAARARSMSVASIHHRLDQRFRLLTGGSRSALERQQTLRATVDWSYSLLGETERAVLRRLSVFAGGFGLEAAESVCAGGVVDCLDVAELVGSLVDKSLVALDEGGGEDRYRLLDTIRQYAAERMLEEGDEAVRQLGDRHAAWCVGLAERAEPHLHTPEQGQWLRRLALEQENLRRALEHLATQAEGAESLFRAAVALARFWLWDYRMQELRELLLPRLDDPPPGIDPLLVGSALVTAAGLSLADLETAGRLIDRALAVARTTGDERLSAFALSAKAARAYLERHLDEGLAAAGEALAVARRLDDPVLVADTMVTVIALVADVHPEQVPQLLEEALDATARSGDRRSELALRSNAGSVALRSGDLSEAELQLERAARLRDELGVHAHQVSVNLGWVRRAQGRLGEARGLFEDALRSSRRHGDLPGLGYGALGLACLELESGRAERAALLLGYSEAQLRLAGDVMLEPELGYREATAAAARSTLGSDVFERAVGSGRALNLQKGFELALDGPRFASEPEAISAAEGAQA